MHPTRVNHAARMFVRFVPFLLAIRASEIDTTINDERGINDVECGENEIWQREPREAPTGVDENYADDEEYEDDRVIVDRVKEGWSTARIFNGKLSDKGAWPWQVSLQLLHPKHGFIGHWCGGVLVESTWIVTAAHCIHNDLFNLPIGVLWTAVLGEWQLESGNRGSVRIPVERVFLHDRFNNYVNDIALMKLSRGAPLSKSIRPIGLPDKDEQSDRRTNDECFTSGWGRSGHSPSLSNALLEANVPLLRLEDCQRAYGNAVPIGPGHLCAGHTDGSSGSCVGDSGGPLQCRKTIDDDWQLVGITSFGSGCARPGYPDVYTRINYYIDWIKTTINTSTDYHVA